MAGLFETVRQFFSDEGWTALPLEGVTALRLQYKGKNGAWGCLARVREEQGQVVFYSMSPIVVPPERRAAIAEFLSRANFGMIVGNFELDVGAGEIRFKTSLELGPELMPEDVAFPQVYGRMVGTSLSMMDRYLPGIVAVVGGGDPAAAIAAIEGPELGGA